MKESYRGPEMAKRGTLITVSDPQPEVRKNAENAKDWEFKSEAAFLYRMAVVFKDRLVDPLYHTDRARVPDPVISFDNLRNNRTLAAYTLARNPQGLLYEISFNTAHYLEKDGQRDWQYYRWAQLETLLLTLFFSHSSHSFLVFG